MWTIAQHTDPTTGAVTWQVRLTDTPDSIVAGGLPDRGAAMDHVRTLLAGALVAAPVDANRGPRFEAVYEEGEEARDGGGYTRVIDPGATNFDRPMPLPLMATDETSWGHNGARLVGAITEASRAGTSTVRLAGHFDTSMRALEFARLVDDGMMPRHSPDLGSDETEFECTEYEEDSWGVYCSAGILHFTAATCLGTTLVPHPALDSAVISLPNGLAADQPGDVTENEPAGVAAAARIAAPSVIVAAPVVERIDPPFPAAWFENPALEAATALTVDPDGRIRGHIATWGTCHIGMEDQCVTPPRSATGYAYAHTGAPVELDNGSRLRVGHITVGTGHAPLRGLTPDQAAGHYDDTGYSAALVRYGEDDHGIWAAGVIDPAATDEQVWALRVAATSGDWRRIEGNLELVATLAVNVPGFPIPDTVAASAHGECVALVAAGARGMARLAERQRPAVSPSMPAELEVLVARLVDARMAEAHASQASAARAAAVRLAAVDAVRAAFGPTPGQVRNRRANMAKNRERISTG